MLKEEKPRSGPEPVSDDDVLGTIIDSSPTTDVSLLRRILQYISHSNSPKEKKNVYDVAAAFRLDKLDKIEQHIS
jgi:hypothetical protein